MKPLGLDGFLVGDGLVDGLVVDVEVVWDTVVGAAVGSSVCATVVSSAGKARKKEGFPMKTYLVEVYSWSYRIPLFEVFQIFLWLIYSIFS